VDTRLHGLQLQEAGLIDFAVPATDATAAAITMTAAQLLGGLLLRNTNGANRADLVPTAASIIAALTARLGAAPVVGNAFEFVIRNTAGAAETITVTTNTGATLSGTMTIAQNNSKRFLLVITGVTTPAYTLYSLGTFVH
jgi:hypothetical protein